MKIFKLSVFCLLFTYSAFAQNTIPDAKVKTIIGQTVNIKDYFEEDKVRILTFWASWCSPCKKELDNIADLYEDWQEDYNAELIAITIDATQDLNKANSIVKSKGWEYIILADPNQDLMRQLNFQAIPQTFLINQKGEIVYTHAGYVDGDEDLLEDEMKKLK